MATKNAALLSFPLDTADGGTSATTLLDHGVLVGAGTGAISGITVGAVGEIVSSDGSAASFGSSSNGDFTFTGQVGITRILKVENTDNTNASSAGLLSISVGGSSSGDVSSKCIVDSIQAFSQGIDNSDSDKFKISSTLALETETFLSSTVSGEIIKPLTSAFGVVASDQANVTGAGTLYTVTFTASEYFDQHSDFDGTSTFTAPVTGKYFFNCVIKYAGIGTEPYVQIRLTTSNRIYAAHIMSASGVKTPSNELTVKMSTITDMDAADTAVVQAYVWSTGSDTVDIVGAGTFFNGYLAC